MMRIAQCNRFKKTMNPEDMQQAEQTESRQAAINVLQMIKHKEYMRKMRENALRSQHINPGEITG